mgnify:FL=1
MKECMQCPIVEVGETAWILEHEPDGGWSKEFGRWLWVSRAQFDVQPR